MTSRNARQWQEVLAGLGDMARRPSPGTWSALGYACHVRDVLRLYDERLVLMLAAAGPRYPDWDQDATAVAGRYAEQDPSRVAADLGDAAGVIAARFGEVSGDQWQRAGLRSDGVRFTVESFGGTSSTIWFIISATSPAYPALLPPPPLPPPPLSDPAASHGFLRRWPAGENQPSPMRPPRGMSAQSVRRARIAGCPPSGYGR